MYLINVKTFNDETNGIMVLKITNNDGNLTAKLEARVSDLDSAGNVQIYTNYDVKDDPKDSHIEPSKL